MVGGLQFKTSGLVFDSAHQPALAEPSATVLKDYSPYGNDGSMSDGSPDWVQLDSGLWVLSFDGNDYVDCGKAGELGTQKSALSFLLWIYPRSVAVNTSPIGENYSDAASIALQWRFGVGIMYGDGTTQTIAAMADPPLNTWTFRAFTFDGAISTSATYIDDEEPTVQVSALTFIRARVHNLWLGRYAGNSYDGLLGLVRVYNRVLSATEIGKHYTAEKFWFGL